MTDYERIIRRPTKGAGSDGKYLDFVFDTIPSGTYRLAGGRCLYKLKEKKVMLESCHHAVHTSPSSGD